MRYLSVPPVIKVGDNVSLYKVDVPCACDVYTLSCDRWKNDQICSREYPEDDDKVKTTQHYLASVT